MGKSRKMHRETRRIKRNRRAMALIKKNLPEHWEISKAMNTITRNFDRAFQVWNRAGSEHDCHIQFNPSTECWEVFLLDWEYDPARILVARAQTPDAALRQYRMRQLITNN